MWKPNAFALYSLTYHIKSTPFILLEENLNNYRVFSVW